MAGQHSRKTDRELALQAYFACNKSFAAAARSIGKTRTFVKRWIRRYEECKDLRDAPRPGRPCKKASSTPEEDGKTKPKRQRQKKQDAGQRSSKRRKTGEDTDVQQYDVTTPSSILVKTPSGMLQLAVGDVGGVSADAVGTADGSSNQRTVETFVPIQSLVIPHPNSTAAALRPAILHTPFLNAAIARHVNACDLKASGVSSNADTVSDQPQSTPHFAFVQYPSLQTLLPFPTNDLFGFIDANNYTPSQPVQSCPAEASAFSRLGSGEFAHSPTQGPTSPFGKRADLHDLLWNLHEANKRDHKSEPCRGNDSPFLQGMLESILANQAGLPPMCQDMEHNSMCQDMEHNNMHLDSQFASSTNGRHVLEDPTSFFPPQPITFPGMNDALQPSSIDPSSTESTSPFLNSHPYISAAPSHSRSSSRSTFAPEDPASDSFAPGKPADTAMCAAFCPVTKQPRSIAATTTEQLTIVEATNTMASSGNMHGSQAADPSTTESELRKRKLRLQAALGVCKVHSVQSIQPSSSGLPNSNPRNMQRGGQPDKVHTNESACLALSQKTVAPASQASQQVADWGTNSQHSDLPLYHDANCSSASGLCSMPATDITSRVDINHGRCAVGVSDEICSLPHAADLLQPAAPLPGCGHGQAPPPADAVSGMLSQPAASHQQPLHGRLHSTTFASRYSPAGSPDLQPLITPEHARPDASAQASAVMDGGTAGVTAEPAASASAGVAERAMSPAQPDAAQTQDKSPDLEVKPSAAGASSAPQGPIPSPPTSQPSLVPSPPPGGVHLSPSWDKCILSFSVSSWSFDFNNSTEVANKHLAESNNIAVMSATACRAQPDDEGMRCAPSAPNDAAADLKSSETDTLLEALSLTMSKCMAEMAGWRDPPSIELLSEEFLTEILQQANLQPDTEQAFENTSTSNAAAAAVAADSSTMMGGNDTLRGAAYTQVQQKDKEAPIFRPPDWAAAAAAALSTDADPAMDIFTICNPFAADARARCCMHSEVNAGADPVTGVQVMTSSAPAVQSSTAGCDFSDAAQGPLDAAGIRSAMCQDNHGALTAGGEFSDAAQGVLDAAGNRPAMCQDNHGALTAGCEFSDAAQGVLDAAGNRSAMCQDNHLSWSFQDCFNAALLQQLSCASLPSVSVNATAPQQQTPSALELLLASLTGTQVGNDEQAAMPPSNNDWPSTVLRSQEFIRQMSTALLGNSNNGHIAAQWPRRQVEQPQQLCCQGMRCSSTLGASKTEPTHLVNLTAGATAGRQQHAGQPQLDNRKGCRAECGGTVAAGGMPMPAGCNREQHDGRASPLLNNTTGSGSSPSRMPMLGSCNGQQHGRAMPLDVNNRTGSAGSAGGMPMPGGCNGQQHGRAAPLLSNKTGGSDGNGAVAGGMPMLGGCNDGQQHPAGLAAELNFRASSADSGSHMTGGVPAMFGAGAGQPGRVLLRTKTQSLYLAQHASAGSPAGSGHTTKPRGCSASRRPCVTITTGCNR